MAGWYLKFGDANGPAVTLRLSGSEQSIGRADENDITIDDSSVSRHHAKLVWDGRARAWALLDMRSRNGSFIGERQLPPHTPVELKEDDEFRLGDVSVQLAFGALPDVRDDDRLKTKSGLADLASLTRKRPDTQPKVRAHAPPSPIRVRAGHRREQIASRFFVSALGMTVAYSVVTAYIIRHEEANRTWFNPLMFLVIGVALILGLVQIRTCGYEWRTVGLSWNNWKRSVAESLIATVVALVAAIVFKWLAVRGGWLTDERFFHDITRHATAASLSIVIPTVLVQEFIIRGIMIAGFEGAYAGEHGTAKAVVFSAALYGVVHLWISIALFVWMFVAGLLFGALYVRHRTLIGVSLLHMFVVLGVFALFGP